MISLEELFLKSDTRSVKARKNIIMSALIKGADMIIYLLLVPLTLGYLNAYEYGIWLTLNSLLMWINSFDIGLGNGLRNKLATAIAEDDQEKGRCYVSTTFYMLIFIVLVIFFTFSALVKYIDWYGILNADRSIVSHLDEIIFVSFFFFCLSFILRFIENVYQALQLPAVNYLIAFLGHLLSLIIIFVLTQTVPGRLFWVAMAYSASTPFVYLTCYPITFSRICPYLAPSFRFFRVEFLKDLLSLGFLFFVIQIMGIVLFSLSNILISNMFGPDQVTPYNIAYRYFSLLPIVFNLLLSPLWSASTDAYAKGDLLWIRNSRKKMVRLLFLVFCIIAFMFVLSDSVYIIWIGHDVMISREMSLFMGIYFFIIIWSLSFSSILNGMGKLHLQAYNIIGVALLFYPLCYYLGREYGVVGIVMGMCIVNIPGAIMNTLQLNMILNGKSNGVWNH